MAEKRPLALYNGRKSELKAGDTFPAETLGEAPSPTFAALTDAATITWNLNSRRVANATVTLGGNRTLSMTNPVSGATGVLIVKQDGTGNRTLTLPTGSKIVGGGGTAPSLSTAANSEDLLAFIYDGTKFIWTVGKGVA